MKKSSNSGKLIGAMLIGAAIGGGLGILFAPNKGSKTRKKIIGQSEDLTDAIKEKFNGFLSDMKSEIKSANKQNSGFLENGIAKVEKMKIHE